jgi:hypothetical protein
LSVNDFDVSEFLRTSGLPFTPTARFNAVANTLILDIPIDLVAQSVEEGKTSRRQLAHLRGSLERDHKISVLIAFRSSAQLNDIEAGLNGLLQRKFPGKVSNFVASFPNAAAVDASVFLSEGIEAPLATEIQTFVNEYFTEAGFTTLSFNLIGNEKPKPSLAAILRSVKLLAPVELADLIRNLDTRGFSCPDERWLAAKLDVVRKRNLVVRSAAGKYVLTTEGLAVVPYSTSRTSSDVERMLALARRKKW